MLCHVLRGSNSLKLKDSNMQQSKWSRSNLCCSKQSVLFGRLWVLNIRLPESFEPFQPYFQPDAEEAAICFNLYSTKGNPRLPKSTTVSSYNMFKNMCVCEFFTLKMAERKNTTTTSRTFIFPVVEACPLSASAKTYRGRSMTTKCQRKGHLCPDLVFTPFHN